MRSSVIAAVLLVCAVASADPSDDIYLVRHQEPRIQEGGMFVDFGVNATKIDGGDGLIYRGEFARFAPQIALNRSFYIGGEIDIGQMDAVVGTTNNAARSTMATPMGELEKTGTLAAGKFVAGARMNAGIITGAVELAPGVRYIELPTDYGANLLVKTEAVMEVRGRLDLWALNNFTVGGIVGADLAHTTDVMVGLQLGLHFDRCTRDRC